jgi:CheY-like chemotaxis protein
MTPPQASTALPRLLLIDDDEISRDVLSMMLEVHGFPVDTAEDGAHALLKLEAEPDAEPDAGPDARPDAESIEVVLMDTQMPGISGLELIEAIRRRSSARVIAISGSEVSDTIRNASDGFLLKPVEAEDLIALLTTQNDNPLPRSGVAPQIQATDAERQQQVIDPGVLGRLTAMMPATAVREIYDAVAADLKKRLVLLEQAMVACNAVEVSRIAHSVKGGSAMVGFTMATEAAGRLEASNRSETWPKELKRLQDALAELERILGGEFPT